MIYMARTSYGQWIVAGYDKTLIFGSKSKAIKAYKALTLGE